MYCGVKANWRKTLSQKPEWTTDPLRPRRYIEQHHEAENLYHSMLFISR